MARTWSGGPGSSLPDLEPINWRRLGVVGVCLLAAVVLLMVGGPAAVASYRHARRVVEVYGDPAMAPWLPLTTDGMLLAALVVMWVRRVVDGNTGRGPWAAFLLGLVATLWANVVAAYIPPDAVAAEPGLIGFFVAVWPPVCLAVTLELLALLVVYTRRRPGERGEDLTDTHEDHPAGTDEPTEQTATEQTATGPADEPISLEQIPAPDEWLEAPVPGDEQTWTDPGPVRAEPLHAELTIGDRIEPPFEVLTDPDRVVVNDWDAPLPDEAYVEPEPDRTEPLGRRGVPGPDRLEADDDTIRAWIREQPTVPTRYAVTQRYRMGPGRARRLLDERTAELEAVGS